MTRVRTSALAAVAVSMLTLAACGGGGEDAEADSGGGTELTMWVNGADTPQELRDYLIATFEDQHPGDTLVIEEQDWTDLLSGLQSSLASEDQTPDLV